MSRAAAEGPDDRRRRERRTEARLADLTVPELRRVVITSTLFVVVLAMFVWMVRTVIIAAILGAVIAAYLRPLYARLTRAFGRATPAALLTLFLALVPIALLAIYSYREVRDVAAYVDAHEEEIAARIDSTISTIPVIDGTVTTESVRNAVVTASDYGAEIPGAVRAALGGFAIGASVFLFTAFYILTQGPAVAGYVRQKVPPRYHELTGAVERNARGVLYGAVYATLVTQSLKTAVVFALNVAFGVPLAGVLALISFVIGFFPIVGSWSVYVPVAGWLIVFRNAPGSAIVMLLVGFLVNTLFISTYLRPKLAAERSRVLNFYWMFLGLVTGVYTFGIAGILLGPILIGVLKAIVDAVTATASWRGVDPAPEGPA